MIKGWLTFDNRIVLMKDISHQHLSNIHHYINTTMPEWYDDSTRKEISDLLQTKFNGVILPYVPHPGFVFEKEVLQKKGFLQPDNNIIIEGIKIGCYE